MKNIKQKFELAVYGYKPGEFMPIYYGGELANRGDFVKYKIGRVLKRITTTN